MSRSNSSTIYENWKSLAEIKEGLKLLKAEVTDKMDTVSSIQTRRHNQNTDRLASVQVAVDDVNKKLDLIIKHLGIEGTK